MSSETTELHPEKSYFDKKFADYDQTKELLQLVRYNQVISIVSLLLVILIGSLSWNDSKEARIQVETKVDQYTEEYRMQQATYLSWRSWAIANGVPVDEIEEKTD
jgi:hypothetical protein